MVTVALFTRTFRALSPVRDESSLARRLSGPAAAIALAGVAGFVDAVGFLTLGGLFTAHMSGNTARLGVVLGRGDLSAAIPIVAAVALFVVGVAIGAVASELAARRGHAATVAVVLFPRPRWSPRS